MITSPANPKVKYVRRLQAERRFRTRENTFVIEGSRWLSDLIQLSVQPQLLFYTPSWYDLDQNAALITQLDAPGLAVSDDLMEMMSDTQSPPGVLAVVPMPSLSIREDASLLLVLDEVTNPGNLGTMMRSAGAAGADGILLGPGCVDPFNPKVVRGGMGAHLRLPLHQESWQQMAARLAGFNVWLAAADGSLSYTEVDWTAPSAIVIGNEAQGAAEEANQLARGRISIPMHVETESLNAAVAASIILFEAARQRREKAQPSAG